MLGQRRFNVAVIVRPVNGRAAAWVPLCVDRLVLAGDHCQLPPTISNEAAEEGLAVSLQERLIGLHNRNRGTDSSVPDARGNHGLLERRVLRRKLVTLSRWPVTLCFFRS